MSGTSADVRALLPEAEALGSYLETLLGPEAPPTADGGAGPSGRAVPALLMEAGGVQVALPQAAIEAVLPWSGRARRPRRGEPPWLLGRMRRAGGTLAVVDLARVVLPRARWPVAGAGGRAGFLVRLDGDWALACARVGDPVLLTDAAVRWRRPDPVRPWLAGVGRTPPCLVLNPVRLRAWLARGLKESAGMDDA